MKISTIGMPRKTPAKLRVEPTMAPRTRMTRMAIAICMRPAVNQAIDPSHARPAAGKPNSGGRGRPIAVPFFNLRLDLAVAPLRVLAGLEALELLARSLGDRAVGGVAVEALVVGLEAAHAAAD